MKYCNWCIQPDTRPGLRLDGQGVCNACRASQDKRGVIDWRRRELAWRRVVAATKSRAGVYDCVIPVSGGKDSHWQVVKCLECGLKPLAVTWKTPARTKVGQENLDNLVSLGVDHIDWQINPNIESKLMLEALKRAGSPAVPMHLALFAIPMKVAAKFNIPLVVWGENAAFEYGSEDEKLLGSKLTGSWLKKHGVTGGTSAADWLSEELTEKDLLAYQWPTDEELREARVRAIFLGYYFHWDPEISLRAAKEHGFRVREEGPKVGYYDYADIDDDFVSIHHYIKWYKFGFTRLWDNLSLEIRTGRMARDEALGIVREWGEQTPCEDIEKFCRFTGITTAEFWCIIERWRNRDIWKMVGGQWRIPGFIIKDYQWRESEKEISAARV